MAGRETSAGDIKSGRAMKPGPEPQLRETASDDATRDQVQRGRHGERSDTEGTLQKMTESGPSPPARREPPLEEE